MVVEDESCNKIKESSIIIVIDDKFATFCDDG